MCFHFFFFCYKNTDDLKTLVIHKYPNSLGKLVDPGDLQIRTLGKPSENGGGSTSSSRNSLHDDGLTGYPQQVIILSPEELVFDALNRLFPNGNMLMSDAFVIGVSQPASLQGQTLAQHQHMHGTSDDQQPLMQQNQQQQMQHSLVSLPHQQGSSSSLPGMTGSHHTLYGLDDHSIEDSPTVSLFSKQDSPVKGTQVTHNISAQHDFVKSTPNQVPASRDSDRSSFSSNNDSSPRSIEKHSFSNLDTNSQDTSTTTLSSNPYANSAPGSSSHLISSSKAQPVIPVSSTTSTNSFTTPTASASNTSTNTTTNTNTSRANPNHGIDNNASTDNTKRAKFQRDSGKPGKGVILLPRQFKNQASSFSFGHKKGISRLTIDTDLGNNSNRNTAISNNSHEHHQLSPYSPSVPLLTDVSVSTNEIHHTKTGAYQRVTKPVSSSAPSSAANLSPQIDGTMPEVLSPRPLLQQKSTEDRTVSQESEITSTQSAPAISALSKNSKSSSNSGKDKKARIQSALGSPSNAQTLSHSQSSPFSSSTRHNDLAGERNANGSSSSGTNSKNPEGATASSVRNNRKLLLSINKGISPYTTVVPQVNVLIVEDNVINQKILETYLRKRKIRSSTAKNGKEAIEKWRQGGFHLVLMDIQLPVMNGIEATKKIRKMENLNRIGVFSSTATTATAATTAVVENESNTRCTINSNGTTNSTHDPDLDEDLDDEVLDATKFKYPVIIVALTASSSLSDKSEALAAGCNDFLTKPVNLKWLEQKTIEWGCMQALIDFEGWKHWVSKESSLQQQQQQQTTTGSSISQSSLLPVSTLQTGFGKLGEGIRNGRSSSAVMRQASKSPARNGAKVNDVGKKSSSLGFLEPLTALESSAAVL